MHPLSELLKDMLLGHSRELWWKVDILIKQYMKERADWLKYEKGFPHARDYREAVDAAFELDEKCEHYCACGEKLQDNGKCPLEPRDEPKPLPSKFMSSDHFDLMDVACKLGDLIDYLHSKEAQ